MVDEAAQERQMIERAESAQSHQVEQFEQKLEALKASLTQADLETLKNENDPTRALNQLSRKVDEISGFEIEAGDLSSAEILVVIQEQFEDHPDLIPILMQKLGIAEKYDDQEIPENKPFIDWALENGADAGLLGVLMDTPIGSRSSSESVLKSAFSRVRKPESSSEIENYNRAILFQALELYIEVPKVKGFIEDSRFMNWTFHREIEGRESLDSLRAPKLELLANVVQRMERDGYFEEEEEEDKQALLQELLDEYRERYDERADLNVQATLVFYEYPVLATDLKYRNQNGTVNGEAVKTFLRNQWAEVSTTQPQREGLAGSGDKTLDGLKKVFSSIGGFFDSKDYTKSKPPIEKLASALDLGDVLADGMDLAALDISTKTYVQGKVEERINLYADNLEKSGKKVDEIVPPIQQSKRTAAQLLPSEIEEIERLWATVGPEWEGTKAKELYERTVWDSFLNPGMPCKKTFEEFIQEDYQMSTIRRLLIECSWIKGIVGFMDEKMGQFIDFLSEKGVPLPAGELTAREELAQAKEELYKGGLITKILETPARYDLVQIQGVAFTQTGLEAIPYQQLYELDNNVLGVQNETATQLRQKNLDLPNLLYLIKSDVRLVGERVSINYGASYGAIEIPLDEKANALIARLQKYESEDTDKLVEEIAKYNFTNDPANTEKIKFLPDVGGIDFFFTQGLIVLDESEDVPVYQFHQEFSELLDQENIWTNVTERMLKKLAEAFTTSGTKLELASVESDKVAIEEESKSLFKEEDTLEFASIRELVGALS